MTENDVIKYVLQNVAPSWAAAANLYLALHTADPGEAGDQTTTEVAYDDYARVLISRAVGAGGWTVTADTAQNTDEEAFPECNVSFVGTVTATHVSVGLAASGASQILYKGALTNPLIISALITPRFPAGTLLVTEA